MGPIPWAVVADVLMPVAMVPMMMFVPFGFEVPQQVKVAEAVARQTPARHHTAFAAFATMRFDNAVVAETNRDMPDPTRTFARAV